MEGSFEFLVCVCNTSSAWCWFCIYIQKYENLRVYMFFFFFFVTVFLSVCVRLFVSFYICTSSICISYVPLLYSSRFASNLSYLFFRITRTSIFRLILSKAISSSWSHFLINQFFSLTTQTISLRCVNVSNITFYLLPHVTSGQVVLRLWLLCGP